MQKNVASQVIGVQMVNASDGSAFTGAASVAVTGDGGTQGAGGGTGPTHEGNGFHTYLPTQAETNYDHIGFTFTGSGAIPVTIQVYTRYDTNTIEVGGDTQSLADLKDFADAGYDPATNKVQGVVLVDTTTTNTDMVSEPPTAAAVADAVWDEAATGHTDAGKAGQQLWTDVDAILADTADMQPKLGTPAGADMSTDIAAVKTDTGNLVTRITATLFSGITSLAEWLGLIAGKQAGDATALTEIKATGAGSGTYDPTTDSNEAVRDKQTDIETDTQAIETDTQDIQSRLPAALVGGRIDADIGAKTGNVALSAQEKLDVNAEADTALTDYDPPTRTEATADKNEILTQLPAAPVKNSAYTYVIKMLDSTDHFTPKTGLTITMTVSIDGAAFGAAGGTVTEISSGHYKVAAAAADMNGDVVAHRFAASGADDLTVEYQTVS